MQNVLHWQRKGRRKGGGGWTRSMNSMYVLSNLAVGLLYPTILEEYNMFQIVAMILEMINEGAPNISRQETNLPSPLKIYIQISCEDFKMPYQSCYINS